MTDTLSNASCCSLTTDMWTGCHSRSYMAVTAHIVSDDWEMKSFCLATREITSAHTADNIAAELSAVIAEWKLDTKVIGITTDNARNVKNAVDSLEFTHFGCIGHTLQPSINRGLQLEAFCSCYYGAKWVILWHYKHCLSSYSQVCSNLDRKEDDSENLKQIKVAIQSDLKERYVGDTAKLLQEPAFLDPRFKQLNFLSDNERKDTIERMKVKMLLAASDESLSCEVSEVEPHQSCSEVEHHQSCKSTGAQSVRRRNCTQHTV